MSQLETSSFDLLTIHTKKVAGKPYPKNIDEAAEGDKQVKEKKTILVGLNKPSGPFQYALTLYEL